MNTLSSTIRYVTKVLRSCKNDEQLDNAMNWAVAVIAEKAKESKIPVDSRGVSHKRLISPRVVACRLCGGIGYHADMVCEQCGGSGRVIVSSDVVTFVTAYKPKDNEYDSND